MEIRQHHAKGFWCAQGLAEHAIHAWTGSRDTVIEGNRIVNSARGIGVGLGESGGGAWRTYQDGPCGGRRDLGHYRANIRNNAILANDPRLGASRAGFDPASASNQPVRAALSTTP